MTANKYTRERKSLCEESMLVLVNILKFSSLFIARNGLVVPKSAPEHTTKKGHSKKSNSRGSGAGGYHPSSGHSNTLSTWGNGSKRAQEPEHGRSNISYLMLPTTENDYYQGHEQQHEHENIAANRRAGQEASALQTPSYSQMVRSDQRNIYKNINIDHNHIHHSHDGGEGKFADYILRFHEKAENDLKNAISERQAAEFIRKFHEKAKKDSNNDSKRFSSLPPPPAVISDHHNHLHHHHVKSRSFT